jgi:cobyric acid synthase CobQ/L-threonine-O-3-phosphate decarboxylase
MSLPEYPQRHTHGGNLHQLSAASGVSAAQLIDFSANINPLGPPEWIRPLVSANISELAHYPDPDCTELITALAKANNLQPEQILVGNGATELLHLLPRALEIKRVLIPVPSYADYEDPARLNGLEITLQPLSASEHFRLDIDQLEAALQPEQLVLLGQPNNPTGMLFDAKQLRQSATRHPETLFVIDESFIDFTDGTQSLRIDRPANVVIIQSMTKAYAIPGLRLGYAIADAEIVSKMRRLLPNWTVNTIAQSVGCRAVQDQDYLQRSRSFVSEQREQLTRALNKIPGLSVYLGTANFLLVRLDHDTLTAAKLAEQTLKMGIAIRVCENFRSLDQRYFRVAVRTSSEQQRLCEVLQGILCPVKTAPVQKKTPAIMFQGTGSNAGKSVLAAAMCRILRQDGYDVAPFKAQNMSLNSFVTSDGGEMGRAQVVQAQACRLEPDVRMNPVLLKPNSDTGSQVILHGRVAGNMHFRDYAEKRKSLFATIKSTYDELSSEHEVMVLEGAGSPAEINLKANDIVNMNMALHAEAPVLMVGDIDRGGVFASFVGTMELLTEQERAQIAGFVINRFRGDASLLDSALEHTRNHTGVPILGVVPFLPQLGLPEEDSVSFKDDGLQQGPAPADQIDIAVVDMPHISNFTDFDALSIEPDVHLRVVRQQKELGRPDALILPGSKNVLADLCFLQKSGLAEKILQLAEKDSCEIVGICGGFQILGRKINDPHRIESDGKALDGLGLLPLETVLARQKTTIQIRTRHLPSGHKLVGYEIHHGQTNSVDMEPIANNSEGEMIGGSVADGRIWGTYLHGVFDADDFRRWFIDRLRTRRGWATDGKIRACYDLEPAFDRLADCVREALDMKVVYRSIGL